MPQFLNVNLRSSLKCVTSAEKGKSFGREMGAVISRIVVERGIVCNT